jgi:hypothetical protein
MLTPPESPMPLFLPMDNVKFNNGGKKVGGAGVGGGRRTSTNGH